MTRAVKMAALGSLLSFLLLATKNDLLGAVGEV
jgi:hypothetical protein